MFFLSRFHFFINWIISLLFCIHYSCLELLRARVHKKKHFINLFFISNCGKNGRILGLGSEMGFNTRDSQR
jgi:hypothetical protein